MKKTDAAEVKITQEMLEAGAFVLIGFDSREESCSETALDVYLAMEKARTSSSKDSP